MTHSSTQPSQALVLAAGRGSRLDSATPKPLHRVVGVPLLARTLFTLHEAGVTEAYVVVGYEADEVRREMESWSKTGLTVHWIYNPDWREPNGVSVLAARDFLDGPFFLSMADHVYEPGIVTKLAKSGVGEGVNLAVDYEVDRVLDPDDATKVGVDEGRIVSIGKELDEYDAIDTGVFLASPALFRAIDQAWAEGAASLSAGVQRLAAQGRAWTTDVSDLFWQDVDTPADLREAKRRLLRTVRKESDGPISRYLNRPLSIALSRVLVHTPVTPNQISVFAMLVSLVSAGFAAMGGYANFLISGVLFQVASVVDGTDGEVAKLTFRSSKRGEWIDTVCDNISYLAFLVGLTVGVERSGYPSFYLLSGVVGFVAGAASIMNLALYVAREKVSGSFRSVRYGYEEGGGWGRRFMRAVHFMGKRDFLAFLAMMLAVLGRLPLALPLFGIGATVLLLPATIKANVSSWLRRRKREAREFSSSEA